MTQQLVDLTGKNMAGDPEEVVTDSLIEALQRQKEGEPANMAQITEVTSSIEPFDIKENVENLFREHFSALQDLAKKNMFLSDLSYIWESSCYKEILLLAKDASASDIVIKLLFQDLLKESSWETLILLGEMLDYQPSPEIRGSFRQMIEEIILLGRSNGYIP